MKKIVLAAACVFACMAGQMNAQVVFSENFNSVTTPNLPAGWTQANLDGQTVNASVTIAFGTNAWVTNTWTAAQGNAAVSCSWFTNPTPAADRWIISPAITCTAGNWLLFNAMAQDPTYRDGYEVRISTTTNATTSFGSPILTVPAENNAITQHALDLSAYNGQTIYIAWRNTSTNDFLLWLDDVVVKTLPANDIAMVGITPAPGSQAGIGAVGATIPMMGTVQNMGSSPITSFTATYTDGITQSTTNVSSVNIAPYTQYTFTCTTPYTIPAAAIIPVKMYATLAGDPTPADDTIATTIIGHSFVPTHRVVFEEATGTWCGWCPRGAVFMDSMYIMNPNTTVLIAVHNSDPMTDAPYDAGVGTSISGYPSILVDRNIVDDPSNAFTQYAAHIGDFGMADLTITPSYNSTSHQATAVVTAKMATSFTNNNTTNDYRLAVVFTEMHVTGTTTSYDQHDYYSYQSQNLPLSGAGHNWQNETNPVSHTKMYYDFVDRTIVGGYWGMANSLPNTIVAGNTYNYTFNYTIPTTDNVNMMKAHVLLIDANNHIIYNGVSADMFTGINNIVEGKQSFSVYPNPAENNLFMDLKLNENDENVVVTFVNFLGQTVLSRNIGSVAAGTSNYSFDVSNLPSGAYFINVTTSKGTASSKFIK